ncbi:tryptophan--tRNA ligase [Candidatus Nomurabacteria bacterium]|nr:tryptophan--tRNA ligase [Candidatus Nomurabacteria bacterium]
MTNKQNKKRLLTGDRPTGKLHLGHYVGSLKNRVAMQDQYESFVMIADVQALTDNFAEPEKVRKNVLEVALDNLAVGIDPKKTTLFIQSQIPEIAELTVFYSNLVTVSELQRNPTVKNEIGDKGHIFKGGNVTFGFLGYPVSQAADITFLRANVVPVGEDQKPMLEQTNEIIRKFHNYYGELFPYPQGVYGEIARLSGLDGRKMSKSFNNAIYLSDSPEEVEKKVKKAKTDSDTVNLVRFDEVKKADVSNLMQYYSIATGKTLKEIEKEFKGITSYKVFKDQLIVELNNFLAPIRARRKKYEENPDLVWKILKKGTAQAKKEAEKTMKLVKEKMMIWY